MSVALRLLRVCFDGRITTSELSMFRGAMIAMSGGNPLFHNHAADGFRYSYPKIQYKLDGGRPSVLGIGEGASALAEMFDGNAGFTCRLGRRLFATEVSSIAEWEEEVSFVPSPVTYLIHDWLPLNVGNFKDYRAAGGMIERLTMLQRILLGNILSFAKGMGIFFHDEVGCSIMDMQSTGTSTFKGVDLMSFSGRFSTNVRLPQWIGLGKASSLNHGTIIRI
ncbi:MAG: hypothetical protein K2M83_14070 [Muribaculaceae bacterium]|nr:hypothetical protein [Muribaculaceae bacterium]